MNKRYTPVSLDEEARKILRQAKAEEDEFISYSDLIKKKLGKHKNENFFPKW